MLDNTQDAGWPGKGKEHIPASKWVKAIKIQIADSPKEPVGFEVFKEGEAAEMIRQAIQEIHKTNPLIEFAVTYRV